ncbi:MAG TPA: UDP-glucose 4-epimerase GalE [Erysipelotrichaceae bacterium]|nr:UDP-glucose 4-epimerase GalE [Erysipelotrichaceae bacterium]HQB32011.1 UDP-glucose 4-epimerase GalE [Erysipelotrichaceae bacterium]
MSKVLLTGGTGFIGSHTALALIENGFEVVIVDNLINSEADVVSRLEKFKNVSIPFYHGDCRDEDLLNRIFQEHKIEIVIHFAGLKAVGESVSFPLEYYENNINATVTVLKTMLKNRVHKLVFSSSATVYAENNPAERVEGHPLGCTNPYGWTKFMSEQIIRDTCQASSQLNAISLRYFNPVGAHPSGIIGENPKGVPNNLMPYIQQVATGIRDYLRVYGNDYDTVDGTGVRDYIHVCDLAEAHVAASKYLQNHKGCLEINIGTGKGVSVLEMVAAFERVNNIKIPYRIEARRSGDLAINYANASKAYQLLGWKAKRNLEDMCRDAYNWQYNLQKNKT